MYLPTINLQKDQLLNFEESLQKEWLVTNGLGGYASSTVLGINTRKYHGLLVAALPPKGERRICLAKIDEEVTIGNTRYSLGSNEYQNGIFPRGHRFLEEFSISPFPKYVYAVEDIKIEKKVWMPNGKNTTIVVYKIWNKGRDKTKIRVFPLVNGRYFHSVRDRRGSSSPQFMQRPINRGINVEFLNSNFVLVMKSTQGEYFSQERWLEGMYFREEADRGESYLDDCYQPGYFEVDLEGNKVKFAIYSQVDEKGEDTGGIKLEDDFILQEIEDCTKKEIRRCRKRVIDFYEAHRGIPEKNWLKWIILATDDFIIRDCTRDHKSVIAGYHWFKTWGRDTFIALPGLMLVTGRSRDAKRVFLTFREHFKHGLIPNFLPEQDEEPVYNSVDATLWYINAVLQYLKYTGDYRFVKEQLWETLKSAVEHYERGTIYGIRRGNEGLLHHGPQMTWMDATIESQPVTPREGLAVEVQALWYNALKVMQLLANVFNEKGSRRYARLAEEAEKGFIDTFWNLEKNSLVDCITGHRYDYRLRPNQIIAVALDFTILDEVKNKKIVDSIHDHLVTPYGLRTLGKKEVRYRGIYAGDRRSRDQAYHNGTVWPWLLGPFTTAFLKTRGNAEKERRYAWKNFLSPLFTHQIFNYGLGTLNEIYDGDPPHKARGCIAQAWSIAEPLRAYVEDILQIRPPKDDVLQIIDQ